MALEKSALEVDEIRVDKETMEMQTNPPRGSRSGGT
jgi:hypothetical protein